LPESRRKLRVRFPARSISLRGNYRFIVGIDYPERLDALTKDVRNDRPTLKSQVEIVRREIQEYGESVVGCAELRVLCPDEVPASTQWNAIARIAESENWSFTYCPDGSVSFAKL
jgi:hypothetical protein